MDSPLHTREINCEHVLRCGADPVFCMAFSSSDSTLCTGNEDGTIRLWRQIDGDWACVKSIESPGSITCCAFQPTPGTMGLLATGSSDNSIRLWDALRGDCANVLQGHRDQISCLVFRPASRTTASTALATGSVDTMVRVWAAPAWAEHLTLKGHKGPISAVAFNPDGSLLASASMDRTLRLWDGVTGATNKVLKEHTGPVLSCAFHPENEFLLSGGQDKSIRVWREGTGEAARELAGHKGWVSALAFSPDGRILATADSKGGASRTNKVWLWDFQAGNRKTDIRNAQNTHVLGGHSGTITALAFVPSGATLASASEDGTVRLWRVSPDPPSGKKKKPPHAAAADGGGGSGKPEAAGAAKPGRLESMSMAEKRKMMGMTRGNFLADWAQEIQDHLWEMSHPDGTETGVQSHQMSGKGGRVNPGHESVMGWTDDPDDGRRGDGGDGGPKCPVQ